jgi:hypothetical protein
MSSRIRPPTSSDTSAPRVWLKYGLALMLSAAALWAGLSGLGPWPESGLVSGLILMATGPFFAMRLRSAGGVARQPASFPLPWGTLPWLTAGAGVVEIVVVVATAALH